MWSLTTIQMTTTGVFDAILKGVVLTALLTLLGCASQLNREPDQDSQSKKHLLSDADDASVDQAEKQGALVTAGVFRAQYAAEGGTCQAYYSWFDQFERYGVSPYDLDQLSQKGSVAQTLRQSNTLPNALLDYLSVLEQFPEELLSERIFNRFFANTYGSLSSSEKDEFVRGARICHRHRELAKGKLEVPSKSIQRPRQTCEAYARWVDTLPEMDLAKASEYRGRLNKFSYAFADKYFTQAFYPRFVDLTADQRRALSENVENCKMHVRSSPHFDWVMQNLVKQGVTVRMLPDMMFHPDPLSERKHQNSGRKRSKKLGLERAQDMAKRAEIHKAVVLFWEAQERNLALMRAGRVSLDVFKDVLRLSTAEFPEITLLGVNQDLTASYIQHQAKALLSEYLGGNSQQLADAFIKDILRRLPPDYVQTYNTDGVIGSVVDMDHLMVFKLAAELKDLRSSAAKVSVSNEVLNNIESSVRVSLEAILAPLIEQDLAAYPASTGLDGLHDGTKWLAGFAQRYEKFQKLNQVIGAKAQALSKRSLAIEHALHQVKKAVAELRKSSDANKLMIRLTHDFDAEFEKGRLLRQVLNNRYLALRSEEKAAREKAIILAKLKRYYSEYEISQLKDGGLFSTQGKAPPPDRETIFRLFYRALNSYYEPRGFPMVIRDDNTISMPASVLGIKLRIDMHVTRLKLGTCRVLRTNAYQCDYELRYRLSPEYEDAAFAEHEKKNAWLAEGLANQYSNDRASKFTHVFEFTQKGWSSLGMEEFYRAEQARVHELNRQWEVSRPKANNCLYWRGLQFSCWDD